MRTMKLTLPDRPEFPGPEENLQGIRDALTANPRALEHQGLSIIRIATGNPSWIRPPAMILVSDPAGALGPGQLVGRHRPGGRAGMPSP